jgi:hypothetical protein
VFNERSLRLVPPYAIADFVFEMLRQAEQERIQIWAWAFVPCETSEQQRVTIKKAMPFSVLRFVCGGGGIGDSVYIVLVNEDFEHEGMSTFLTA